MRYTVLILLSVTSLSAYAGGFQDMVKDAIKHEIERKMPMPPSSPQVILEAPQRQEARFNTHWRLSSRLGPVMYTDDNFEDGYMGRFRFRPQGGIKAFREDNLLKFSLELRKDF